MRNLHKKSSLAGGVPAASPMPKSISFKEKNRDQLLMVLQLRIFLWCNCSIFIIGDHDDFPC